MNRESLSPTAALLEDVETPDFSREVGAVSVQGRWDASRHVTLDYGTSVARYGYLPNDGLVSPNAVVTVEPLDRTRVRVAVAQNMLAPGAEEFLPPADGVWLPPERTFALLSRTDSLRAERSQHFEVAVERDLGRASTVGVRRFYQDVDDQTVALFGVRPQVAVSSADHYYLTSAAGVNSEGWGLMFSHTLAGRVRGTVDYSLTHADWAPWAASGLSPQTVGIFRTGTERFHDVTTSIETEIPETATEVFVLYRVNSAFSVVDADTAALTSGLDGRFALRVRPDPAVFTGRGQRLGSARGHQKPIPRTGSRCLGLRRAACRKSAQTGRGWAGRSLLESPAAPEVVMPRTSSDSS